MPSPSTTTTTTNNLKSFPQISTHLLTTARLALPPPGPPTSKPLTPLIASLRLHPTLEAALHILNADLPSAHFLLRHMQAPPAVEGMLLHSILHRCEGDFANARAWIADVGDACAGFLPKHRSEGRKLDGRVWEEIVRNGVEEGEVGLVGFVYGEEGVEGALGLVDDVEFFRKRKGGAGERGSLEGTVREEMERVVEWCVGKFGEGEWGDARSAWTKNSEEVQRMSDSMVAGGKGFREF